MHRYLVGSSILRHEEQTDQPTFHDFPTRPMRRNSRCLQQQQERSGRDILLFLAVQPSHAINEWMNKCIQIKTTTGPDGRACQWEEKPPTKVPYARDRNPAAHTEGSRSYKTQTDLQRKKIKCMLVSQQSLPPSFHPSIMPHRPEIIIQMYCRCSERELHQCTRSMNTHAPLFAHFTVQCTRCTMLPFAILDSGCISVCLKENHSDLSQDAICCCFTTEHVCILRAVVSKEAVT